MNETTCPHCGGIHTAEMRFCPITGTPLRPNADQARTELAKTDDKFDQDKAAQKTLFGPGPPRPKAGSETIMMYAQPPPTPPEASAPPTPAAPTTRMTPVQIPAPPDLAPLGPFGHPPTPAPDRTIMEALPAGLLAAALDATTAAPATALAPSGVAATIAAPLPESPKTNVETPFAHEPTAYAGGGDAEAVPHPVPAGSSGSRASGIAGDSGVVSDGTGRTTGGAIPSWAITPDDGDGADLGAPAAAPSAFPAALKEFGALLRQSLGIYLDSLVPLLTVAAVILGPPFLISSGLTAAFVQVIPNGGLIALNFVLTFLVLGAAWPLCTAAIAITVLGYLKGQPIHGKELADLLKRQARPLALALLPVGVAIALGYLLFVIPGLIAQVFFALVPIAVLLENQQGGAALKRSAVLIRDMLAPTVGVLICFGVLAALVTRIIMSILPHYAGIDLIGAALVSIVMAPLPMIALTLLYRNLRRKQDGLSDEDLLRPLER